MPQASSQPARPPHPLWTLTEGRALFARWCEAAGLTMGVDEMGTMFAGRPGTDPEAHLLPWYRSPTKLAGISLVMVIILNVIFR